MTFTLLNPLDPNPFQDFASIVHLGAGPYFDPRDYDFPKLKKAILIDADAEACAELRQETAGNPIFEVHQLFLQPEAGMAPFFTYNLRDLNGPVEILSENGVYANLRKLSANKMESTAVAELTKQMDKLPGPCLWIVSLPGLEIPLLKKLMSSTLSLDWILWKGNGLIKTANATKLKDLESLLNTAGFRSVAQASNHSEAKPQILFHRDPRNLPLLERISTLETLLKEKEDWLKLEETLKAKVSSLEPLLKEKEEWLKHEVALKARLSIMDEEVARINVKIELLKELIKYDGNDSKKKSFDDSLT